MVRDLTIEQSPGQEGVLVEGNTTEGEEFVDAWPNIIEAIDAGRIVVEDNEASKIEDAAKAAGLTTYSYL